VETTPVQLHATLFPSGDPAGRGISSYIVSRHALHWDRVLCSAGKRGWDVAVHPQDLIRLTNAVTADIRTSG
jgi:prolyl-tRNA editing enzyme YbaK/EbsC (Cys-tRNA(Pro) deacylase)